MLTTSFAGFDEKLQSKGQSETQRQQARRAIIIFYRMVGAIKSSSTPAGDTSPKNPLASARLSTSSPVSSNQTSLPSTIPEKLVFSVAAETLKLTGANWKALYEQQQTAIKVRHYSNKTWQANRYWLQQFQTYTKSKDARLLDTVPSRTIKEAKSPLDY